MIIEYQKEGLDIGRDTGPVDRETTERVFSEFYKRLGEKKPAFWYCQSPFQAQIIINLLENIDENIAENIGSNIESNIRSNIDENILSNIYENIDENIESNIGSNIRSNIDENIVSNIVSNIVENIGSNIRLNIAENIYENIGSNIRSNIAENIWSNIRSNIDENIVENIGSNIRSNIDENIWSNIRLNIAENIVENIASNIVSNIRSNIDENIWSNIWSNIRSNIYENIAENIESNIWSNIRSNIYEKIYENIESNIWSNIYENIYENIVSNIVSNIRSNIGLNIRSNIDENRYIFTYCWGQHDIGWVQYNSYFVNSGLLPEDDNFAIIRMWKDLSKSAGWCYTLKNVVFVCEKPSELHINENGKLHKDGSMALKYSDGYGLYMLNGVQVPKWLAVSRDTEIRPSKIAEIDNVEIRREFVRKIGIERIKYSLGAKTIHTDTYIIGGKSLTYNLLEFDFKDVTARALEMQNPSLPDVQHIEFVPLECETVEDAWLFRVNLKKDDIDNESGYDWYMQGDVIIRKKGVKKFKMFPVVIA